MNNAGDMSNRFGLDERNEEQYERVVDFNSHSMTMASRVALSHFQRTGGCNIMHSTSLAVLDGGGAGLYASTKGFVSTVTRNMA
ncbi:SDR family NAD(P)-dependent oxidoreductase [Vreelandella hamiltonii]|uniref:SDR family NAD(P)-dependent oxidoreductase n=1 Tax=Vreelandella hamiltonii TaxID=502829 RepID=UPI003BF53F61